MKQKVKELRIRLDGLGQLIKELKPLENSLLMPENVGLSYNSREIVKATDSLFLAKARLGKVLGELGEDSPYPKDGSRKTVEDIEPTADVAEFKIVKYSDKYKDEKGVDWNNANHIEKVDWLRQGISVVINAIIDIRISSVVGIITNEIIRLHFERIDQHLSEARFWLGFELERVREEDKESKIN